MDLNSLKYSDLQRLAKDAGIKANIKSDKLRKCLEEYYAAQQKHGGKRKSGPGMAHPTSPTTACSTEPAAAEHEAEPERRGVKHKRRGTYELEESTVGNDDVTSNKTDTTSTEGKNRQNKKPRSREPRQSTIDLINCMDVTSGSHNMKQSLMDAIDKKVAKNKSKGPVPNSKIPQFSKTTAKPTQKGTITPGNKDWSAIHQRNFNKMDSIDVYLHKKQRRADALTNASQPSLSDTINKAQVAIDKQRKYQTPEAVTKNVTKKRSTIVKSKLFPTPGTSTFKPMVLSTKDLNVNFADMKPSATVFRFTSGSSGPSKIAKPVVRRSPRGTGASVRVKTPGVSKTVTSGVRVKTPAISHSSAVRKSTFATATPPKSTKKATFDLQQSLSRPLSWVPYKGKVKPVETQALATKEKIAARQSKATQSHVQARKSHGVTARKSPGKNFKTPTLKNTKETRRKDAAQSRADKQFNERMKRRGLAA